MQAALHSNANTFVVSGTATTKSISSMGGGAGDYSRMVSQMGGANAMDQKTVAAMASKIGAGKLPEGMDLAALQKMMAQMAGGAGGAGDDDNDSMPELEPGDSFEDVSSR